MTESPAPRSCRMLVLWAVALALLLAVGLFCWLVVVPHMDTGRMIETYVGADNRARTAESEFERVGGPAIRE